MKIKLLSKKISEEVNNFKEKNLVLVIAEDLEGIIEKINLVTNGVKNISVEVDDELVEGTFFVEVEDGA